MTSTPPTPAAPPRLHVTAYLPPVISFSSVDEPHLEIRITLSYSQPIILALKRSRLGPLHLHSALTLHHASSGQQEYLPRVDAPLSNPPVPPLTAEHKDEFVGLKPRETTVFRVSFRPYSEPYDYAEVKQAQGAERYKMLFPLGMQFLKPGEVYEVGVREGYTQTYMVGDLDQLVGEMDQSVTWMPADGSVEVIPGERCRFRVIA
jgi:hypothetical protein